MNYSKTNVEDDTKLRANCRKAGVEYSVVKNTMLRLVFNATNYSDLNERLNGMTAFAYSKDDVIAPAKVLCEFAKSHENFEIKGGFFDGKVVSIDEIKELASIPSKEVLIAKMRGSMNGPIQSLACVLQAVIDKQNEQQA